MRLSFWRKCRVCFRWCRIGAWLALLAALCTLLWVNQIGLPDFLKTQLVKTLHTRGIELTFTRLRWRITRGIVAENIRIDDATISDSPALSLAEAQLQFDFRALLHRRLQIDGLILRQGKFIWPLSPTNALTLQNIQADLRFQTNNTWSLDNFRAEFAGMKLALSGDIANAPEIKNSEIFRGKKTGGRAKLQSQLRKFSDALDQIHFEGAPQLNLTVNGDARDIHSFIVRVNASAPFVQTPHFGARDFQFTVKLTAPADAPTNFDSSWDVWTNTQSYQLEWSARLANLRSKKLNADSLVGNGLWRAPELTVGNLSAKLGGGQFDDAAKLNVATRELTFTNFSDFDVRTVAALLTEKMRRQLAEISWTQPPRLQIGGSVVLPAWTNNEPDWRGEVQPTVSLAVQLSVTNAVVRGVKIDAAQTHFTYKNLVWDFSDLAFVQSKTHLEIVGTEHDATKKFSGHVRGVFDPETAWPFLTASNAVHAFKIVTFTEPLALDVTASGRLDDFNGLAANGNVALTNFAVRGENFGDVTTAVNYTNRVLELLHPLMHTGVQTATADKIILDFNARLIYFTNGFTRTDPEKFTRAIGPKTARLVAPYHFLQTPTARVNGQIPLRDMNGGRDMEGVDMRFDVLQLTPFQWSRLKTPGIMGTIHWLGQTLILTNVTADFYGGRGNGFASFDFRPAHPGADYKFMMDVTNVDLHLFVAGMTARTNHLEGALAGKLTVTHADTRDWLTWDGFGNARLRDGLIWDAPIFGILSPVLNTLSPGLGNSRATEATAKFSITNGVIFTDSLEIRSLVARLNYIGTADLNGKVNARVTAQLLRDIWVVGPLISTIFTPVSKLFEYQVSGSLQNPKMAPVYVPKFLLMPLHPIRSLEQMFPAGDNVTNAPAGN
jgi:hypothetical protein